MTTSWQPGTRHQSDFDERTTKISLTASDHLDHKMEAADDVWHLWTRDWQHFFKNSLVMDEDPECTTTHMTTFHLKRNSRVPSYDPEHAVTRATRTAFNNSDRKTPVWRPRIHHEGDYKDVRRPQHIWWPWTHLRGWRQNPTTASYDLDTIDLQERTILEVTHQINVPARQFFQTKNVLKDELLENPKWWGRFFFLHFIAMQCCLTHFFFTLKMFYLFTDLFWFYFFGWRLGVKLSIQSELSKSFINETQRTFIRYTTCWDMCAGCMCEEALLKWDEVFNDQKKKVTRF